MRKPSIYLILSLLITTLLWFLSKDTSTSFIEQFEAQPFRFISQISALLAFNLICFSFLLSSRFKWIDRNWGGLDKTYKLHQYIGGLSFALIIQHPIFLALQALPNRDLALSYFVPQTTAWLMGALALYSLLILLIPSLFLKLPYQLWKFTHGFLGLSFLFLGIHLILTPSDHSRYLPLTLWVILGAIVGSYSYIYKKFLYKWLGPHQSFKIIEIKNQKDIISLFLKPTQIPKFNYFPGEFVYLRLTKGKHRNQEHPFSISWLGPESVIRVSIKTVGDFTKNLNSLKKGDIVDVYGSYGKMAEKFRLPISRDLVLIGGGIGITPMLGLLSSNYSPDQKVWCYYCCSNKDDAVFNAELEAYAKALPNFKYHLQLSSVEGRINAQKIKEGLPNFKQSLFFLCGPKPMMNELTAQLIMAGIPAKNIVIEDFNLLT
jgi:predicted ferric reductase